LFLFVLEETAFKFFMFEPVPDVPWVRLWGSIGTRIPIWVIYDFMVTRFQCVARNSKRESLEKKELLVIQRKKKQALIV
jgi:hypothetical protein